MRGRWLAIGIGLSAALGCAVELPSAGREDEADATSSPADRAALASRAAGAACVATATRDGESKLCASCECGSCTAEAAGCFGTGDPTSDALCGAVVRCAHQNGCTGDACYCGKGLEAASCLVRAQGPCVAEIDAAVGGRNVYAMWKARDGKDPASPFVRAERLLACSDEQCAPACAPASEPCSLNDLACQDRLCGREGAWSAAREAERAASATTLETPVVESILVAGRVVWTRGDATRPRLAAGQEVVLRGRGFGRGGDVDFAKILVGNSRVLETDLRVFEQKLDILKQVNYELPNVQSRWDRDVVRWSDGEVAFRVPVHASRGPLVVQVQKRLPPNESLVRPGEPHLVVDAQTLRIRDASFRQSCDVVSGLGEARASEPIAVDVDNPKLLELVAKGREIFWAYDFNIGTAHAFRNLDWSKVLKREATDPMTGGPADPLTLFGAYPTVPGEVPDEALAPVTFDPYPQPSPIPGFLAVGPQKKSGRTRGTGYVGYRYAESVHPFKGNGEWIGFNCASCHGERITYEAAPGQTVTRVFPGLPNSRWSMKWAVLDRFEGIVADEEGPRWAPGKAAIDKTALLYSMPEGAGEHTIVRLSGEGSTTDNDYQFSPIAIPNVTNHMPIRRSLSHTESYVGFEGSYIHSQEPDGALGSMRAEPLQALTAYMTTLDRDDDVLRRVGLYRWLAWKGELAANVGAVSEGAFVQAGWSAFPALATRLDRGRAIFAARCGSCHEDGVGAHTTERMVRLDEVGRFFAPTIYQREMQSVRATYLRNLYWVQHRGLLSDGHVRNLEDLVSPARCAKGTPLYEAYYTLHEPRDPGPAGPDFPIAYPETGRRGDVFRVPRAASRSGDDTGAKRNRFIERHRYFVTVPWDPEHYYWDYQKLRTEYGPAELGTAGPLVLPDAPHPWCAGSEDEVLDLVGYLLTL